VLPIKKICRKSQISKIGSIFWFKKELIETKVTRWVDLSSKGWQIEITGDFFSSKNCPYLATKKGDFQPTEKYHT